MGALFCLADLHLAIMGPEQHLMLVKVSYPMLIYFCNNCPPGHQVRLQRTLETANSMPAVYLVQPKSLQ